MAIALRWTILAVSVAVTAYSAWLLTLLARADGWTALDSLRLTLSTICIFWLAWGTSSGVLGLFARYRLKLQPAMASTSRTAILMPIYHEDPPSTFARVAAISARLTALGAHGTFDIFILSDSQLIDAAARETLWFERLLTDCAAREQIFYRRRSKNIGRKAGNIEDFIRHSGAAYDYALVLDADSLMDAEAILTMVARMDAAPGLGLLQSLPMIVNAQSLFGRVVQYAMHLYTPAYARGMSMLQGRNGPFWGHNAMFRVRAFAESCGLPELIGKPPFGGHILSHDYVEAALLARAGYEVRLDPDIPGSFEESPDNMIDFAKRDQRWCQGNLQHARVLLAPQFNIWNRITLLQGIGSYLMPLAWLLLLIVSLLAAAAPGHIHRGHVQSGAGWALIIIVAAVLLLPKVLIGVQTLNEGRAPGPLPVLTLPLSVAGEIVLSSIFAPIVLMYQVRAVLRVVFGIDGGWPASDRASSALSLSQAWAGSWWITSTGATALAAAISVTPAIALWSLPVALPMIAAPLIIAWTSQPATRLFWLWSVMPEQNPSPVLREWRRIRQSWTGPAHPLEQDFTTEGGAADVVG